MARLVLKVALMLSALLYAWLKEEESIQSGWNLCRYLLGVGGIQSPFREVREEALALILDQGLPKEGRWKVIHKSVSGLDTEGFGAFNVLGDFGAYLGEDGCVHIWDRYDFNSERLAPEEQQLATFSLAVPKWTARFEDKILAIYGWLEKAFGLEGYVLVTLEGKFSEAEVHIRDDFWEEYLGGKPFLQKDVFSPEEIRSANS